MDSLVFENVRHRPLRTAISGAGVALGVLLTVLTVGLAHGMLRNTAERQANVLAEIMFYPAGDFSPATGQALALDTLYVNAMLLMLTFGIRTGTTLYFEAALVIGALGFVSTAAAAKFLLRGEVIE